MSSTSILTPTPAPTPVAGQPAAPAGLAGLSSSRLAEPTAEGRRHSHRLSRRLRAQIRRAGGWLGFERFMQQALYAPGLGYYQAGLPKFGARGDFITAPLMGDLTARCLAGQCAQVLADIGHGDVLEFGAGTGRLAADLLTALEQLGTLPGRYLIVETSADLRARQRRTIAALGAPLRERVHWLERLPQGGFDGVALATEVLDAMPAMRFEIDAKGRALALGVATEAGDGDANQPVLRWATAGPLPDHLQRRVDGAALGVGYRSEMGLQAEAWVRSVGEKLNTGVLLLIDYGFPRREFYHPQRRDGTLMCHYRHIAHGDPFFYPGLQDISVHVDFTAIADAAGDAALKLAGFASQGAFLLSLGILDNLAESRQHGAQGRRRALAMTRELGRLTLPHEMGELFKVIAFTRRYDRPLRGFALKDRRAALE